MNSEFEEVTKDWYFFTLLSVILFIAFVLAPFKDGMFLIPLLIISNIIMWWDLVIMYLIIRNGDDV